MINFILSNPFAILVAMLQFCAATVYGYQGKWAHAGLWGLYAVCNLLLCEIARRAT